MKAREEMPLLRCALGPTGRPFGDGLHSATASGTDGRKVVITRNWDMAGSTLKKPIRGRKMGVGACGQSVDIWEAARTENVEAVKQHLAASTDVNAKTGSGRTPLHYAAREGHKEINDLLLANGADVNAKNDESGTPLDWAECCAD